MTFWRKNDSGSEYILGKLNIIVYLIVFVVITSKSYSII